MEMFLICLFAFNFFRFGQLFDLNDEEFLSDITFFNRSYAELRLLSSNKLINIWLKPYISNEGQNEEVIDKKCLFTGQVVIAHNIRGAVIISICGERITGIFNFNEIQYSLNPYNPWSSTYLSKDSEGWRRSRRSLPPNILSRIRHDSDDSAICANEMPDVERVLNRVRGYELGQDQSDIHFGKVTIKLAIFMDEPLFRYRFHSDMTEAKEFVAINVAYLQKQLQHKNMLRNVDFRVVIVHFSVAPFLDTHEWSIVEYLQHFCNWVKFNTTNYSHVNVLLSGASLWWMVDGKLSTSIRGLASVGQLCAAKYSCLIVEAREGFKSLRVLVHEFGHNIGAQHDGKPEFKTTECDGSAYIMSWAVGNGKVTWSKCSIKFIRLLLLSMKRDEETNEIKHLKKDALPMDSSLDVTQAKYKKPGLRITPDQQCKMVFGPRFSYYYEDQDNICLRMKCKDDFFVVTTWGAMEGTECGGNRKCEYDRCRRMPLGDFNKYVRLGMTNINLRYIKQ